MHQKTYNCFINNGELGYTKIAAESLDEANYAAKAWVVDTAFGADTKATLCVVPDYECHYTEVEVPADIRKLVALNRVSQRRIDESTIIVVFLKDGKEYSAKYELDDGCWSMTQDSSGVLSRLLTSGGNGTDTEKLMLELLRIFPDYREFKVAIPSVLSVSYYGTNDTRVSDKSVRAVKASLAASYPGLRVVEEEMYGNQFTPRFLYSANGCDKQWEINRAAFKLVGEEMLKNLNEFRDGKL